MALGAIGLSAQTALTELTFDSDSLANTGSGSTTFSSTGSVSYTSGLVGDAISFDGSSYLTANDSGISTGLTVTFWMNTTTAGSSNGNYWYTGSGLVDGEQPGVTNDWGISLLGDKIAFGVGATTSGIDETLSTIVSTSSVNTGSWVFVAVTWDTSGTMSLYINGVLEATVASSRTDARNATYNYYVGANYGYASSSSSTAYTGLLDEIAIYSTALTSADISSIYAATAVPEPATYAALAGLAALGLVAYRRRA